MFVHLQRTGTNGPPTLADMANLRTMINELITALRK